MNKVPFMRNFGAKFCLLATLIGACFQLSADQIEMQNGDRYVGTVLSLNANTLVLHSEVLGDLTLPRVQVAHISLRPGAATNLVSRPAANISHSPALSPARTNAPSEDLP